MTTFRSKDDAERIIRKRAETFFEWPTETRMYVTTESAILFAREVAEMVLAEEDRAQGGSKLYVWTPRGHGQLSYFMVARDERSAREAVDEKVKTDRKKYGNCSVLGWGTDYYELRVYDIGEGVESEEETSE